jgi:hypothetical protein
LACIKHHGEVSLGSEDVCFQSKCQGFNPDYSLEALGLLMGTPNCLIRGSLEAQLEVKMKKILFIALIMSLLLVLAVPVVMADGHCPGNGHQSCASTLKGKGGASAFVHEHVSNAGGNGNGMPALHGVSGMDFGAAVSACAPIAQNHPCVP